MLNFLYFIFVFVFAILTLIYMAMPDLVQNTIPFGIRIPPEYIHNPYIREMKKIFRKWVVLVGITSIIVYTLMSITINNSDTIAIFNVTLFSVIFSFFIIYYIIHKKIGKRKVEEGWYSNKPTYTYASLDMDRDSELKIWVVLLPFIIIFVTIIIGIWRYPSLPANFPVHYAINGTPNGWMSKTPFNVFLIVVIAFLVNVFIDLLMYATVIYSKRDIDPAHPYVSQKQQIKFTNIMFEYLQIMLVFVNVSFMFSAFQIWGLIGSDQLSVVFITIPVFIGVVILVAATYKTGQSGAKIVINDTGKDTKNGHLHIDDDMFWIGGFIYYNKEDPSIFVGKRFGVGWTLNFGNPKAWVIIFLIILFIIATTLMIIFHRNI